jgi:hypothetical protein
MAYQTFRVEITRDETRDGGPVGIEITACTGRGRAMFTRAAKGRFGPA